MPNAVARILLFSLLIASLPWSVSAIEPVAFGPGDTDPTRVDRTMTGWVAVESFGGDLVGVTVDAVREGTRPDGTADHVVRFTAAEPISPALYFRGHALVDFERRTLRVVPLDGSEAIVLSVDGVATEEGREGERRFGGGSELIYVSDRDFGTVEQAIGDLRPEERRPGPLTVTATIEEEHQPSPPDGGGGGCARSCSISCAGGGGSCSAECHRTKCAECSCASEQNLASCSCN